MIHKEAKIYIRKELSAYYPENEVLGFIRIIFEDVFDLSQTQLISNENTKISEEKLSSLKKITNRLKNYEPIQYIIGQTEFYGLKFNVNKHVLIPRQETEELVDLIIKDNKNNPSLHILDLGTGSACIAVSLAKYLTNPSVFGLDINKNIIETAKSNCLLNSVQVTFIQGDIFGRLPLLFDEKFDVIVSNPPYVTDAEKEDMLPNVLNYEPESALFVRDHEPLSYYEAISEFALHHLNKKGTLYFEINEKYGDEVCSLLKDKGFINICLIKDINGRDRIVKSEI